MKMYNKIYTFITVIAITLMVCSFAVSAEDFVGTIPEIDSSGVFIGNGALTVSGALSAKSRVMLTVTKPAFKTVKDVSEVEYVKSQNTGNDGMFSFCIPTPATPQHGNYTLVVTATNMTTPNLMMGTPTEDIDYQNYIKTFRFYCGVDVENFSMGEANGTVTASATLINDDSEDITPCIVLAAYDKITGSLEFCSVDQTKKVDKYTSGPLSTKLILGNNVDKYDYKAFIFDSITNIKPLANVEDTLN